jgi:primosomal protein N' (replication factor Y)
VVNKLTPGQQQCVNSITAALRNTPGRFLLNGITGSGKTEVYMGAIDECLKMGKGAIVLVLRYL